MTTGTPLDREICLMGVSCYIGRSTMKSKFEYSIKRHITFCSYEKLWITLTALMVISVFWMIRGSTAELLIDTKITRFLFWSDENGDKTLYNIAISYFAAYVFYILQVYIPECQTAHCRRCKPHFIFGELASPIVPYRNSPQTLCGLTADCRSFV